MEFRILGSLEVRSDAGPITPAGAKPRALLAMLVLHANEPVSAERLAIALWGDEAPASAAKAIQVHVSRLRRALGETGVLATTAAGYQLRVRPGELDADRFEELAAEGHRALAAGRAPRAGDVLREALSLWRGPALADVAFEVFAQAEIARLEDERLAALEARVEADLALGRHGELAGELAQLVADHPLRERLHGQLMLSLYRSGRQADALQVYRDARDTLVERLGIEPGPELRELERAILAQDAALDLVPPPAQASERATAALIPAPPTPTIGREADLAGLRGEVTEPASRLITLVGPGGVGKTRLALELARSIRDELRDGAYFVALAPVDSFEDVASTIARQLDVVLLPSESADRALVRQLGDRDALLVLDNFEHVLGAAPLVADLVAATTDLTVLVTSREPLRLRAERVVRLDPLAVPPLESNGDRAVVELAPAVALFLAVARARDATFAVSDENAPALAGVCRRLDGLPLAIELAAARIGMLTVPELAERLRDGLDAVGAAPRDVPERQRTLTATLEWSYALLTAGERRALARLAAFAGGCSLDAAQAVTEASLDVLAALVEKNLVVRRAGFEGHTRLTLLETVADFARIRLAAQQDEDEVRGRHFEYYLAFAERAAPELERFGPQELFAEIDLEIHNLRSALGWALDRRASSRALRLATALLEYWLDRGLREGAKWLRSALALAGEEVPARTRAAALGAYAWCLDGPGTFDDVEAAALQSIELAHSIGDFAQCADSTSAVAVAAVDAHRYGDAYRYAAEAGRLARAGRDEPKLAQALHTMAVSAPTLAEALVLSEQAAAIHRRMGNEREIAFLAADVSYAALVHGEHTAAQRLTSDALQAAEKLGDPLALSFACGNQGLVKLLTGDAARASEAFARELRLASRQVHERRLAEAFGGLAAVAAAQGDDELAARLGGAAESAWPSAHHPAIVRELDDRYLTSARARLGEQAWQSARAAGAALTRQQAVDAALHAHHVDSSRAG